ncbi:MAG TPA: hypothetical protein VNU72_02860 [Puia sp.]|nr:hypothetical protein [Puia sp.]
MLDSPKDKAEKARAIKRLLAKWFKAQETKSKAHLLLTKNPGIRITGVAAGKKQS